MRSIIIIKQRCCDVWCLELLQVSKKWWRVGQLPRAARRLPRPWRCRCRCRCVVVVAVAVAVAVEIILAATMAVADGSGRHLGLGRGRGFGRDCLRRTWLGAVPAAAAAAAVVLTVSAVAVAASELWLLPWPPWAGQFLVLVVCVIIIVGLSMGAWARTFAWLHACSWRWS